jgi:hypothetical protein
MLACELDIDTYAAVGLACCMWDWVGETMPQGNIGSAPDRIIAQVVGWRGDPAKLVQAMVKVKLLDTDETHRLVVHDWSEHSEDGVHVYLARRRLFFADGRSPRTRTLPSVERNDADVFYATTVPQTKCGKNVAPPQSDHIPKADVSERSDSDRFGSDRPESVRSEATPPPTPQGGSVPGEAVNPTRRRKPKAAAPTIDAVAFVFEGRGFVGAEFRAVLEEFYGHRIEGGKPMTLRAAAAIAADFEGYTVQDIIRCLRQSVANQWQGVFPEKVRRTGPASVAAANRGGAASIDSVIAEAQRLRELEERRSA